MLQRLLFEEKVPQNLAKQWVMKKELGYNENEHLSTVKWYSI